MSDGKANPGRPDCDTRKIEQDYEVRDWCQSPGLTQEELRQTVRAVGASVSRVSAFLQKQRA